ncbi:MAG: 7-cyano-7-deazaguanine synthase QueC [Thermoanaerobaculia bacterium]|nr:7-cyano-7-deazaguanine synthase QueC [Thermoanaerobaculia bacterium]
MESPGRAVVLLSGGLDSATCFLIARAEGREVFALSFDYGQRHALELERARALAARYGAAEHQVIRMEWPSPAASALTNATREVRKNRLGEEAIPATYVPARNTVFLALAIGYAESVGASDVFIGANALDYSGYPDCRPEFLEAFEQVANLGTRAGALGEMRYRIHAPLLQMTKGEIVAKAAELGLDFSLTLSCYDPSHEGHPCGACDACLLRAKGFLEAGINDQPLSI